MNYAIQAKNIIFKYDKNSEVIVDDFSYSFEQGKIYLISGDSGCGKSTLINVLAGLYPDNSGILLSGKINVFDKDISNYPPEQRVLNIMMMFQDVDTQFCMDTVKDEMIFVLENIDFPPEKMDDLLENILDSLGILYLKDRKIHTLSGGEKQKIALACILEIRPKIIILDEPFANIDQDSSQFILNILNNLNIEYNTTIIAIEHRLSLWNNIKHGSIYLDKYCKISSKQNAETDIPNYYLAYLNRKEYRNNIISKADAIKTSNLNIEYEGRNVLSDINIFIKERTITSIIGKSGAGKTSLLKIIAGMGKNKTGDIEIFGKNIKKIKNKDLINTVGIVFQDPHDQFITYKVIDEIIFTLKKVKPKSSDEERYNEALAVLKQFNLDEYYNYSPYSLSQGQQRKLALLSILVSGQRIILCDEPTYGQDDKTTVEIMEFLKQKVESSGLTVLMVSHDQDMVFKYSDLVYEIIDNKVMLK